MKTLSPIYMVLAICHLVSCSPKFKTRDDALMALRSNNADQRRSAIDFYYDEEDVPVDVVPELINSLQKEKETDYIVRGLFALSKTKSVKAKLVIERFFDSPERDLFVPAGRALQKWLAKNEVGSDRFEEYDPSKNFMPALQRHFLPTNPESVMVLPEACPSNVSIIGSIYKSAGGVSQRKMIDKLREDAATVGGMGICGISFGEGAAGVAVMNMVLTQSVVWNGSCKVYRTSLER